MQNLVTFITILFIPLICYFVVFLLVFNNKKKSSKEVSGFEIGRAILDSNGLNNMYIVEARGKMTDEYDFSHHSVRLSTSVFHDNYIYSVAIASYYATIALMNKENDSYLKVKEMFFPVSNFLILMAVLLAFIGAVAGDSLAGLGIAILLIILIVDLAMIPLALKINKRTISELTKNNLIDPSEVSAVKNILTIYIFSCVGSIVDGAASFVVNSLFNKKK